MFINYYDILFEFYDMNIIIHDEFFMTSTDVFPRYRIFPGHKGLQNTDNMIKI